MSHNRLLIKRQGKAPNVGFFGLPEPLKVIGREYSGMIRHNIRQWFITINCTREDPAKACLKHSGRPRGSKLPAMKQNTAEDVDSQENIDQARRTKARVGQTNTS